MKYLRILFLAIPFLLQSYKSNNHNPQQQHGKHWVSLFNGKDLDGWKPKIAGYPLGENFGNTVRVADKILSTRYNEYDSFNSRFGALYYDKKFTNYRLKVEYRFVGNLTPGAPSWGFRDGGIQYHCQSPATVGLNQPFPVCLEYNLLGGKETGERPTGEICASGIYVEMNGKRNTNYCTPPTVKRTFAGDQWVTAEIEVMDGKITHFVNGEQVLQFENPRFDSTHQEGKKFIIEGKDMVKDGYISLQSNSHPMDFRKIEIMEY
jgi:hypothetical protein